MDHLVGIDEIRKELSERIPSNYHDDVRRLVDNLPIVPDNDEIQSWLQWVKNCPDLKTISTTVPFGVLPSCYTGILHDIRVFSKNGPDDIVYEVSADIRRNIARGNCILELYDSKGQKFYRILSRGLRKFTGEVFDDDDCEEGDNDRWKTYFIKPIEEAVQGIKVNKYDGEAGHFSAFWISGRFVCVGGSKNVHAVFYQKSDVEKYNENRFRVARNINETIWNKLESLGHRERNLLLSFLHHYHLTINVEFVNSDDQRVEDLSHIAGKDLRFLAWTRNELETSESYCVLTPDVGMEVAKAFSNFQTCKYEYFDPVDYKHLFTKIQEECHHEGAVMYFVDKEKSVIGLIKRKTLWYILLRVIFLHSRHALLAKSRQEELIEEKMYKMRSRFDRIQTFHRFTSNCKEKWLSLAEGFLNWGRNALTRNAIALDDLKYRFPWVWKKYLREQMKSDVIPSQL